PAGAIGRGDAFVLQIADRANADVFSNDSFQEFHGQYPWLFDEGRLIGGKPVSNVGWVFVLRAPVRGPASRRSVREARKGAKKSAAVKPLEAPAGTRAAKGPARDAAKAAPAKAAPAKKVAAKTARRSGREPINDNLAYATFVIDHPVGSIVDGTVDRFSSHGAYVRIGEAQAYVPLRDLGNPPPRSAREVLNLGETRPFVVHRFDPVRRGIDVVPVAEALVTSERGSHAAEAVAPATGNTQQTPHAEEAHVSPEAKKAGGRKKAAAKRAPARKKKAAAKRAPARKKSTGRKSTARKSTAKKAGGRKKKAGGRKKAAAKRSTARKSTARK